MQSSQTNKKEKLHGRNSLSKRKMQTFRTLSGVNVLPLFVCVCIHCFKISLWRHLGVWLVLGDCFAVIEIFIIHWNNYCVIFYTRSCSRCTIRKCLGSGWFNCSIFNSVPNYSERCLGFWTWSIQQVFTTALVSAFSWNLKCIFPEVLCINYL